ncbi:MAG TPA: translesion error-prone DNA polymerase V autoproteolytic subunit [Pyrinomonadaceae bacterium]|jgi:DNA polymerase V
MNELRSFVNGRVFEEVEEPLLLPLILSYVSAGFPSPVQDYIETSIDLNKQLIRHPQATFCMRVSGDSMIDAGIRPNARLIVDRMVETKSGDIVIARVGDEMCVKELLIDDEGKVFLVPKNDNYKPPDLDFEVCGKVIYSINQH